MKKKNDKNELKDFSFRRIDLKKDKTEIIELECRIMYANESYLSRRYDFPAYRERWYKGGRPKRIIDDIRKSLKDPRTICEFAVAPSGEKAAFYCVTYIDVGGFDHVVAWLEDIYVFEPFRRLGVASAIVKRIEARAKMEGAQLFGAGTSAFNAPSKGMFEKNGFSVYRNNYEKEL